MPGKYRQDRRWVNTRRHLSERHRDAVGRPPALGPDARALIAKFLASTPSEYGYSVSRWTVPLFLRALGKYGYPSCGRTLRKLLHALGYYWDCQAGEWRQL